MLETHAIIIRLEGAEAIVEADQTGGCGQCNSANGCGSGRVSKLFCTRPRHFRVQNGIGAQVGDEVQVSIADGELLRSALTIYVFPLVTLFAGAAAGTAAASTGLEDVYAAVGALAGLAAGFMLVRLFSLRQQMRISSLPQVISPADARSGYRSPG